MSIDLDLNALVVNSVLTDITDAKILIVDDVVMNIDLLKEILREDGFRNLFSTNDPYQIYPLYQQHGFDLIILDLKMPGMSGIEVLKKFKKIIKTSFLPIVVLTAHADRINRTQALELGAKDYITKPFNNWDIQLRLRNTLQASLYHRQQVFKKDLLENEINKRTKEILETQMEIVQRLAVAGELRDNETGAHVQRMSHICRLLSVQRGLGAEFSELVLYASAMHDVGKIGIPDSILLKSKQLTPEEWLIMKQHPKIGARIIGTHGSKLISLAREIALYHHEKWDGSGYPHCLSGNEIPVSARIAAISDVFDALTSDRPYKKAWPIEKVVETIKQESGRHFEPIMVELFIENLPEILKIKDQYHDDDFYFH